ncbi:MAG: nicotinate-nucleotide adenylyltransferase [Flavobacteriaceae bacterium]|nr:MAG: nicotinate-nucleotide adenylyltransferase [Flavobacteriaceae bacterium]
MEVKHVLTPLQKALKINLDGRFYGSFSEIGAGQEASRFFFKAGATSNSMAKSMSAYSKDFSDAIYGKQSGRYVSKPRLQKMLEHETNLLEKRLIESPHKDKLYFTYANTVTTINWEKTNPGDGWMGIRFKTDASQQEYSEILIHVRFHQNSARLQQSTLGIMGVNLVYGALFLNQAPKSLQKSLYDHISISDIEIDSINFSGPVFANIDNRIMSLFLVQNKMTDAVIFSPSQNLMASDLFYKKNVYVLRGSFKPITTLGIEVFEKGLEAFIKEQNVDRENLEVLFEITTNNLKSSNEGELNEQDFLDRVDLIGALGYNVLISNHSEYYKLVNYFTKFTKAQIGVTLGLHNLLEIFDEKYYAELPGGILESFGKLFIRNLKLYVYPYLNLENGDLYDSNTLSIPEDLKELYAYFKKKRSILDIEGIDKESLNIDSINVPGLIKSGLDDWKKYVPKEIAQLIEDKKLFGKS